MQRRGYTAALFVISACRFPELAFHKPDSADDMMDAAAVVPSCLNVNATCGAAGDSCCTSLPVPGGSFFRDHDVANAQPLSGGLNYPAAVNSFRLDKYDVTVGRFRQFVLAGMGTQRHPPEQGAGAHPAFPASGWDPSWNTSLAADTTELKMGINCSSDQTWSDLPRTAVDENRPMNCLTWYEAMAFCIWDGGYLPSEAEWNYAALGGDEQRAFPWSSPASSLMIDSSYVSYSPQDNNCTGDGMPGCGPTDIVPVGSLPNGNGRWGHADLAGNLYQWMFDWYDTYGGCDNGCPNAVMPGGPDPLRVMRGGAFVYPPDNLRGAARSNLYPWRRNYISGVRCARNM